MATAVKDKGTTAAETEANGTATAAQDEQAKRVRAAKPTYGIKKVTKLPENAKIKRGPSNRNTYRDLLLPVTLDESLWGEWLEVATFNTQAGARMKMKEMEKAGVEGLGVLADGFTWEFAARRLVEETAEGERKYSVLYAKCEPNT